MNKYSFKVNSNKSVNDFLLENVNLSLNIINKIKKGCIFINGKLNKNLNDALCPNDLLEIVLPVDEVNSYASFVNYPLEIIYEDEYFMAVVKEKGMLTHTSKYSVAPTLESAVVSRFAPNPFTFRAINRLDKDTSGIVLVAKDIISASLFNSLIKKGEIKKTYSAIIVNKPKDERFIIDAPIDREKEGNIKRVVSPQGKNAITECLSITPLTNNLYKAEILLHTGRTHQIRVHFAYIGCPLYADELYGEKVENKTYTLHAEKLEFIHPFTKEKLTLTAPIKIKD